MSPPKRRNCTVKGREGGKKLVKLGRRLLWMVPKLRCDNVSHCLMALMNLDVQIQIQTYNQNMQELFPQVLILIAKLLKLNQRIENRINVPW